MLSEASVCVYSEFENASSGKQNAQNVGSVEALRFSGVMMAGCLTGGV